jgi:integrase
MAQVLTDAAVQRYKPGAVRRIIRDAKATSLYLVVQPSGHKSWMMRFRRNGGAAAKIVLGPVDASGRESAGEPTIGMPLTLAGARQLAAQVHRDRAMGRDPIADHRLRKQRAAATAGAANTFGAAAADFVQQYASKKVRRWKEQARLLGLDPEDLAPISGGLATRWANKPVADITGHDIHVLIVETRERGAPGLERRSDGPTESRARAMLSCLSRMFRWLLQHRRAETNPCTGVHRPDTPPARDRVLADAEIVRFWAATDAVGEPLGALLRLLLLTGSRLNEVAQMTRAELSDDLKVWSLPSARTKTPSRARRAAPTPGARHPAGRAAYRGLSVRVQHQRPHAGLRMEQVQAAA